MHSISIYYIYIGSVQFSSVASEFVSDSIGPHESQHARPPCPSPTPVVYPNSCPSSWWCHPTISSSVVPFSSFPQSFPASGSFQMSQLFASGGQSVGVSASASVLPMNTQDWSPLGWTGWIFLQSKGLSRVFSNTPVQKHQFFSAQLSFFFLLFFFKTWNTVLVLPNIKTNPPQVYMCSPSWALLPPPSPHHPSGSSQCTSPKHRVSCFLYSPTLTSIHDHWKNHSLG